MVSEAARVQALLARGRFKRGEAIALGLAAFAIALGTAAWVADTGQGSLAAAALPANASLISFDDRFSSLSSPAPSRAAAASRAEVSVPVTDRFASATLLELRLQDARSQLSRQLTGGEWRAALLEGSVPTGETAPQSQSGVPMPRPRPAAANLQAGVAVADNAPRTEERSLLQKLGDLLPGRVRLVSLTPDSGLFSQGPDLAALGYDRQTAVYDISARAVYLPSGLSLEAHSGMGGLKDDPEHVQEPMVGATPPATYDLKPREKLFHGVAALRMSPVGSTTFGRSGLLTHSYMLGPNGDSNGCVSIKNYDRFLKAYNDGEFNRMVVVPSLSGTTQVSQRASSDS
jgi:hypothetical protein